MGFRKLEFANQHPIFSSPIQFFSSPIHFFPSPIQNLTFGFQFLFKPIRFFLGLSSFFVDSPKKHPNFPLQISYPISKTQDLCIASLLKNWAGNFGQEIGRGFGRKNREENWMGFLSRPEKLDFEIVCAGQELGGRGRGGQ